MERAEEIRAERRAGAHIETEDSGMSIWKRLGVFAAVLLAVFLLGLIPMWLSERETAEERDIAQESLRISHLQNRLATSALEARRGEYEQARVALSDFFTELRAEVDRPASTRALNDKQREALQPILARRDEMITLLARSDPASAEQLLNLYFDYLQAMNSSSQTKK